MCIHHYYYHRPCGHSVKNAPLSLRYHCEDLERALVYYHDQPKYKLLDAELSIFFGISITEQLKTPKICPEVWPPVADGVKEKQARVSEFGGWGGISQRSVHAVGEKLDQETTAITQRLLTERSDARFLREANESHDPRQIPYPRDQVEHILSFQARQLNPHPRAPCNVIQHAVPWGCGRHDSPACLVGHNFPIGPLCPYLLASRLPRAKPTQEARMLGSNSPMSRGGAINELGQYAKIKQFTRSAPGKVDRGGLTPLPLSREFLDSIRAINKSSTEQAAKEPEVREQEMWYLYANGQKPPPGLYQFDL